MAGDFLFAVLKKNIYFYDILFNGIFPSEKNCVMKLLNIIVLSLTVFFCLEVSAQTEYPGKNFYVAVKNGTRTLTGVPGKDYKNNFAEYKIDAKFDSQTHILEGEETILYHYNSGAPTTTMVVNLYRNIYKKGVQRLRQCAVEDITDEGMEILDVQQILKTGKNSDVFTSISGTKLFITLNGRMKEGETVSIYIKWRNKIAANTHHRGGKYRENSWFIPYWYPQIAVYDDIYGWDRINHSGNEEFLFEFANYDVNLTIADNLCVWATGELQNRDQIFNKNIITLIDKASRTNAKIDIITPQNRSAVLKQSQNTWHFKADSVPDFVFACSNEVNWTMSSLQVAPKKPRTKTSVVYFDGRFKGVLDMVNKTLDYLSNQRPNVPYPYSHMTIFQGSGGMEFPMMVNEDFDNNYDDDFFTTSHEVTHSYFPFMTGMYQNRYAFMDEGLTMFVPQTFQNNNFEHRDIITSAVRNMLYSQGSDDNVPVMTPSYSQTDLWVYTINSYYKPQLAYTFLEDIVGEEVMSKILKEFTLNWIGKHPHPYDFFNFCEHVSSLNLKEFFYSWFFITGVPDLAVIQVKDNVITIENKGSIMLPIYLKINYKDGTTEIIERNALCWAGGNNVVNMSVKKDIEFIQIGNERIPDADLSNNNWRADK